MDSNKTQLGLPENYSNLVKPALVPDLFIQYIHFFSDKSTFCINQCELEDIFRVHKMAFGQLGEMKKHFKSA